MPAGLFFGRRLWPENTPKGIFDEVWRDEAQLLNTVSKKTAPGGTPPPGSAFTMYGNAAALFLQGAPIDPRDVHSVLDAAPQRSKERQKNPVDFDERMEERFARHMVSVDAARPMTHKYVAE